MSEIRIDDVLDEAGWRALPPCADPGFDHRTCDFWEDAERGSKAARLAWLEAPTAPTIPPPPAPSDNPFLVERPNEPAFNPFATGGTSAFNPFLDDDDVAEVANPFAPGAGATKPGAGSAPTGPRKLGLLLRGAGVFGSYAKVLVRDGEPAAYCQFGPLTAYPRAQRTRELYPQLPEAPLPAVITCIATTAAARGEGLGRRLVGAVCDDLAARGFSAVEAYPEISAPPDETSAAVPAFWESAGFTRVVDDPRFPVMRRELA
jgi:ribosomal protein S18 acetylase RimI-like enzyme